MLDGFSKAALYLGDMTLGERIKALRKARGLSQPRLASELGVTAQAVSQWERNITKPSRENLLAMHQKHGADFDWLAYGSADVHGRDIKSRNTKFTLARLISTVQAGSWSEISQEEPVDESTRFFELEEPGTGAVFALEIKGESMEPDFEAGDVVIVDTGLPPIPGDFVVAKLDNENEATFKKYRPRNSAASVIELSPLNNDYPTLEISPSSPGRIVGVMIEHRRFRRRKRLKRN